MEYAVEITKDAAWAIIENDDLAWIEYLQTEFAETSFYYAKGVRIAIIYNYLTNVSQYYIQDINA